MIASPSKPSENGVQSQPRDDGSGASSTSDLSTLSSSDKAQDKDKQVNGQGGKKRPRESDISTTSKSAQSKSKKAKPTAENNINGHAEEVKKERGVYCHICRRACEPNHYLTCTKTKPKTSTSTIMKQCNLSYCDRDLTVRYDITMDKINDIRQTGNGRKEEENYQWECPCCKDECQSSGCRKKKGLEPLGNLKQPARASNGHTLAEDPNETLTSVNGHSNATPANNKSKGKSNTEKKEDVTVIEDDSDLSDVEPVVKKKAGRPSNSKVNGETPSKVNGNTPQAKKRGRPSKSNGNADIPEEEGDSGTRGSVISSESTALTDLEEPESSAEPKKKKGRASKLTLNESPKKEDGTPGQKKKGRPSQANGDISTPKAKKIKAETSVSKSTPKAKEKTPKGKSAKTEGEARKKPGPKPKNTPVVEIEAAKSKKGKVKEDGKATPKKGVKKGKDEKEKEKKIKPKPIKKPEIIPDPPVFEKVDTKLGREEAEQRIMLREYLYRFRAVLSFPERALPAIDDFDRPLTEASVRLFAGAMLDMIKDELQNSENEELTGTLFNVREELRYYADLARFQGIFNMLSNPLDLQLPPPIIDHRAEANNSALRAILDLDDNQPSPAWATELTAGPSKRTGASRIPPPNEVIRMLLAFADRTLSTPKIRGDMESFVPENDMRRKHASAIKKETSMMETKKKKLNEARLKCKNAAETKAHKEEYEKELKEHAMRLDHINVNLDAQLARRALRHEPLGTDLDGRVYYHLAPREIEEQGRPPLGWASSLLVWGVGSPETSSGGKGEGDIGLPSSIERWSYFSRSKDVKQLIIWLEWKFKKHIESIKPQKSKSITSTPKKSLNVSTPSKANLSSSSKKQTPGTTPKLKQKTLLGVIIPTSSSKLKSSSTANNTENGMNEKSDVSTMVKALGADEQDGDDETLSDSSGLTPPPSKSSKEELLISLKPPKDYQPPPELVEENATKLIDRLKSVLRWLEVLEWQGYGVIA